MKKTLYLLPIAILIAITSCKQSSGNKNSSQVESETTESHSAIELHEKLMTYFAGDWMERESDPNLYPDFYGGSFIDNNGTFVVAVTGNKQENNKLLIEIFGTDNFKIETVSYSYRDMMEVMDDIDKFYSICRKVA